MEAKDVVQKVGSDIKMLRLEQLQDAIQQLSSHKMYADDIMNAINSADEKEIGASMFMWICRYLELEIERN